MKPTAVARLVFAVLATMIILFGIVAIFRNSILAYRNWWGGLVFGPFAIIVGALFFYVLVIHPERIQDRVRRHKKRY